jgi:hypothetical protein
VNCIRFAEAANAIVCKTGARLDRARARGVANHSKCEVMALTLAEIPIVADVHGRSLSDSFC